MKLARLASKLYPRWWRERYGDEFAALLEDARPGVAGALDIAKGALAVQLTTWSPWRVFAVFAVAGVAASVAAYLGQPARPVSRALVHIPAVNRPEQATELTDRLAAAATRVLNRTSLANSLRELYLYPGELRRQPVEDVIEQMRRDIRIEAVPHGQSMAVAVEFRNSASSFDGEDREAQTKAAADWLAKKIVESGAGFEVLEAAALPARGKKGVPRWLFYYGAPAGVAFGLAAAWWVRRKRAQPAS